MELEPEVEELLLDAKVEELEKRVKELEAVMESRLKGHRRWTNFKLNTRNDKYGSFFTRRVFPVILWINGEKNDST